MLKFDLPADKLPQHGEELTLENMITLGSLAPGKYKLEVAVTDNLAKQTITPTTDFTVKPLPASAQLRGGEAFESPSDSLLEPRVFGVCFLRSRLWRPRPTPGKFPGSWWIRRGTPQMGATVLVSSEQILAHRRSSFSPTITGAFPPLRFPPDFIRSR